MVQVYATSSGGPVLDTNRRDILYGDIGVDRFSIGRDGKTDTVINFENDRDKIDLTDFNVNWSEVQIKYLGNGEFVITIRGERTKIQFEEPVGGYSQNMLNEDDFIFVETTQDPVPNIHLDANGATTLYGTDQTDHFIMFRDNTRDVIKEFDPTKDKIDLSAFGIDYEDLEFADKSAGRVLVKLGTETVVIRDISKSLVVADLTEDMFILV